MTTYTVYLSCEAEDDDGSCWQAFGPPDVDLGRFASQDEAESYMQEVERLCKEHKPKESGD